MVLAAAVESVAVVVGLAGLLGSLVPAVFKLFLFRRMRARASSINLRIAGLEVTFDLDSPREAGEYLAALEGMRSEEAAREALKDHESGVRNSGHRSSDDEGQT